MTDKFLQTFENSMNKYRFLGWSWCMWSSVGFSVLALTLALLCPSAPYKWFCFAGMAFSTLGDWLLSPFTPLRRHFGDNMLLVGGSAFAVAHCFYAFGFYKKALAQGGLHFSARICFGLILTLAVVGLSVANAKNKKPNWAFTAATMLYGGFICLNCSMIFGSAVASGTLGAWLTVLGAALFYASDAILLLGAVGPTKVKYYDAWIWITYPVAQALLVCFA